MVYKTPGVKIEEITKLPPSIAAVETAIPVFIGYTQKAKAGNEDLRMEPKKILSIFDYLRFFGSAQPETGITVTFTTPVGGGADEITSAIENRSIYLMYYALQAFFDNGGGPCYIVSVGDYSTGTVSDQDLIKGLAAAGKVDEVTLNVFPDSVNITDAATYYALHKASLDQCVSLQDRFAIIDIYMTAGAVDPITEDAAAMRSSGLGADKDVLKYGATYFPYLVTLYDYIYENSGVNVDINGDTKTLAEWEGEDNARYNQARNAISTQLNVILPPSSSIAGIYAQVDNARGVWKAPANVNIDNVLRTNVKISDQEQRDLNVDAVGGKSINAIRAFKGRGPAMVWGARTLAGNDNEWRYINVRRFFNMVEESTKNATFQFVFEPNDKNTWTRVKGMIANFLTLQWRAGALMGTTPEEAYFVKVGLNETMSELDILEGRMIVEIGMAVVRPAEFIILQFSHKMVSES